ncbi:MAG: phage protein Gp37 [Phycisphaerae bacterium]
MSRLGDLETVFIDRLSQGLISGSPAFATVRGVSGGDRPALRAALRRERMPAAYVGFTEDPTAPEVRLQVRGAKFAVLLAARSLRTESDPRQGDAQTIGAFDLLDVARAQLDGYLPSAGFRIQNLHEKFIDADDRVAIFESLFRVWPIAAQTLALSFGGAALVGPDSRMTLEAGPVGADAAEFAFHGRSVVHRKTLAASRQTLLWRGEVRARDHAELNRIEATIEERIGGRATGDVVEAGARRFRRCRLEAYFRRGGRFEADGLIVQEAELLFSHPALGAAAAQGASGGSVA